MNIIEDIRDALLHGVENRSPPPRTPMDLWTVLKDEWCELPPRYLQTLVISFQDAQFVDAASDTCCDLCAVCKCTYNGLIHHAWLNPDQRLKGNLHEQANADRNDRLDVSPNWRVGKKLVWLEG
ncbi:hypothetical protein AVEN_255167-1 [Araneus ventricosus]|uniref:Uncharacterized protein n=1 Tax=Araneus ventricosus TaxID=182803 RepID=A0A4Y2B9I3_ARAVE|nr:hypothetical protein AVEN_255167-1 [Araneus ventricosus]